MFNAELWKAGAVPANALTFWARGTGGTLLVRFLMRHRE
jgi:hypothetical protein